MDVLYVTYIQYGTYVAGGCCEWWPLHRSERTARATLSPSGRHSRCESRTRGARRRASALCASRDARAAAGPAARSGGARRARQPPPPRASRSRVPRRRRRLRCHSPPERLRANECPVECELNMNFCPINLESRRELCCRAEGHYQAESAHRSEWWPSCSSGPPEGQPEAPKW